MELFGKSYVDRPNANEAMYPCWFRNKENLLHIYKEGGRSYLHKTLQ